VGAEIQGGKKRWKETLISADHSQYSIFHVLPFSNPYSSNPVNLGILCSFLRVVVLRPSVLELRNDWSVVGSHGSVYRAKLVSFEIWRLGEVSVFRSTWQHEVRISAVRGLASSCRWQSRGWIRKEKPSYTCMDSARGGHCFFAPTPLCVLTHIAG